MRNQVSFKSSECGTAGPSFTSRSQEKSPRATPAQPAVGIPENRGAACPETTAKGRISRSSRIACADDAGISSDKPGAVAAQPPTIDILIHQLLEQTQANSSSEVRQRTSSEHEEAGDERNILLDVEIDGMRYQLFQSKCKPIATIPGTSQLRDAVAFSAREWEIARMIAIGYPNKTIARVLEISSWTVNTYLRRMFTKLNVQSRAAMIARVMEKGKLQAQSFTPGNARVPHNY
jgi:DNA-binding CsgD family transcriptional regulator